MSACNPGTTDSVELAPLAEAQVSQQIGSLVSTQQAKLHAGDGAANENFGGSVAISGTTAVVGADHDDGRGAGAGAVYVFVGSGTTWIQQAKLTAADAAANENFGGSVALSGDTLLVGAIFDSEVGGSALGAAYVFVRSGTTWIQQAKLIAADGTADDQFGTSVAISGDTAVIGSVNDSDSGDHSGSAYVFVRSGTSWAQQAKLTAADGAAFDQFGAAVSVSGNTALVGALGDDDHGQDSGSAYVFVRAGTSWTQQAKLTAADAADGDHFGTSVALSGDTALLGASRDDDHGQDSGSAYVFVRGGTSWTQQAKLTAADGAPDDRFGGAIALEGDTALVTAPFDDDLSGSAYVFLRSGATWSEQAKLVAADGESVDLFGVSVAVSGTTVVVGAVGDDDLGSSSGSIYVYGPALNDNGTACTTNGQCDSGFCTDGVCCNTACGTSDPDDCQVCSVGAGAAVDGTCGLRAAGAVCRGAAGVCDAVERCTGTSASCPADGLTSADTVCRPASSSCDLRERCTGGSTSCPADKHKPDLSLCTGVLGLPGICLLGTCVL